MSNGLAITAAALTAKNLGMFPEANPDADASTLEGFLRGNKNGTYKPQYENFMTRMDYEGQLTTATVETFFSDRGYTVEKDEWFGFKATKGDIKLSVVVTEPMFTTPLISVTVNVWSL